MIAYCVFIWLVVVNTAVTLQHVQNPKNSSNEPICNELETLVLKPVEDLAGVIHGKLTTNVTIQPRLQQPLACLDDPPTPASQTNCYRQWGFTPSVAECWADEERNLIKNCQALCWKDHSSLYCQNCGAQQRQIKWQCTFKQMKIRNICANCMQEAYTFWDTNCARVCIDDVFSGSIEPTAGQVCRKCSSFVYEGMIQRCRNN